MPVTPAKRPPSKVLSVLWVVRFDVERYPSTGPRLRSKARGDQSGKRVPDVSAVALSLPSAVPSRDPVGGASPDETFAGTVRGICGSLFVPVGAVLGPTDRVAGLGEVDTGRSIPRSLAYPIVVARVAAAAQRSGMARSGAGAPLPNTATMRHEEGTRSPRD